jgi:YHS domain-containing protein
MDSKTSETAHIESEYELSQTIHHIGKVKDQQRNAMDSPNNAPRAVKTLIKTIKVHARGEDFRILQVQGTLLVCSKAHGNCPATARWKSEYAGRTFSFCSPGCKKSFDREPQVYLDEIGLGEACGVVLPNTTPLAPSTNT